MSYFNKNQIICPYCNKIEHLVICSECSSAVCNDCYKKLHYFQCKSKDLLDYYHKQIQTGKFILKKKIIN